MYLERPVSLKPLTPWHGFLEGGVATFPGFVEDAGENGLLAVHANLGCLSPMSMYSRTCMGAIVSTGVSANTLSKLASFIPWLAKVVETLRRKRSAASAGSANIAILQCLLVAVSR